MVNTVLFDACVLYPAPLRDLVMHLAVSKLVQPRWSDEIHDEWTRNVAADRPDLSAARLDRCRRLMNFHVRESLVAGYEHLIPHLSLPDPDDRHVLAAAIHGRAEILVTFNLRDFPVATLATYGIEVMHPDPFLVRLWDDSPSERILEALRRQRADLRHPPKTAGELLLTLGQCGLGEFVARVAPFVGRF